MNTKTINTRTNKEGDIILMTNNVELKKYLGILSGLIFRNETLKYVTLKGYKSNFGDPAYVFSFWGADSLEGALRKECMENTIYRNGTDLIPFVDSINALESELRSKFTEMDQDTITEILPELKEKFNAHRTKLANKPKIFIDYTLLEDAA